MAYYVVRDCVGPKQKPLSTPVLICSGDSVGCEREGVASLMFAPLSEGRQLGMGIVRSPIWCAMQLDCTEASKVFQAHTGARTGADTYG